MEYLDIVDEEGNPTGLKVDRNKAHKEGIRHRTSHVWIIDDNKVLLQKRSLNKDSYPGCYDISSAGHIPYGSDYKESAIRELQEELGIKAKEEDLHQIGITKSDSYHIFHGQPFHNVQISKVYLLFYDGQSFKLQKEELSSIKWIDIEECKELVKNNKIKHCIKISELNMISEYLKRK